MGDTYRFNTLYDGSCRPQSYGDVVITSETAWAGTIYEIERPVGATGIIYPLDTTTGRKSAPEPASLFRIGMTKSIPKKFTKLNQRNTGRTDMDKGHIIALELGGPDVPHNICPQFSQFQRNGEWRQMENIAHSFAVAEETAGFQVSMTVTIYYSDSQSLSRGRTPKVFVVDLRSDSGATKGWRISNRQDPTDFAMSGRIFDALDPQEEGENYQYQPWDKLQRPIVASFSDDDGQDIWNKRSNQALWASTDDSEDDPDWMDLSD